MSLRLWIVPKGKGDNEVLVSRTKPKRTETDAYRPDIGDTVCVNWSSTDPESAFLCVLLLKKIVKIPTGEEAELWEFSAKPVRKKKRKK